MATTTPTHDYDPRTTPREAIVEFFWFGVMSMLALTASLVIVGGAFVLGGTVIQIAVSVLLVLTIAHQWNQHRHRYELARDPRLRHARERRGF